MNGCVDKNSQTRFHRIDRYTAEPRDPESNVKMTGKEILVFLRNRIPFSQSVRCLVNNSPRDIVRILSETSPYESWYVVVPVLFCFTIGPQEPVR